MLISLPADTPPSGRSSPDLSPLGITLDLTPLPTYKEPCMTEVTLDGLLPRGALLLREDLSAGCGGQTWPAGMVLARHMLRYRGGDLGQERM